MSVMEGSAIYAGRLDTRDDALWHARLHLGSVARSHTAAPLAGIAETAGHVIFEEDLTRVLVGSEPRLLHTLVAVEYEPAAAESDEPGATSATLLLQAFGELAGWLSLTQDNLARYIGISASTIMGWKRDRDVHPRHGRISALLRLWAAVSGAMEEFGEAETLRRVWASGTGPSEGVPGVPADELAEQLIVAADEAARGDGDDDGYDPATAARLSVEEIAAGEQDLSDGLSQYLEGSGESGRA